MTFINPKLAEVVKRDPRYTYEAYEFVFQALQHAQKRLGRLPPSDDAKSGYFFGSEAFIRRMLSPAAKISEKRRLECFNNLVMLNNASLWDAVAPSIRARTHVVTPTFSTQDSMSAMADAVLA